MATPKEMFDQIVSNIKQFGLAQKIIAAVVLVVVFGALLTLSFGGAKIHYKVLFSGLTQEDASEVVAKLGEQRTPYKLSEDGTAILVPANRVHETRLAMAGQGLPRGGGVGFEIFDKTSLGTTDFVNRLNYQRALQGELARTIRQFQQVQEARVHIATPRESVFIEDEKPPSASVSVKLKGREKLSSNQVQSIVNLVSSAVPGLTPENITVVDTSGRLLFRKKGGEESFMSATQLEYQASIEEGLRHKVETMLEEVVGVNRVRAQVTAEIDFSRVNVMEESFDPETPVVRSEKLHIEGEDAAGLDGAGIPGVKGSLATFAGEGAGGGGQSSSFKSNDVTRNFEISKTTKHVQEPTGSIKRLSVAVMVDGTYDKTENEDGETVLQYKARTPEEMQWFDKLVKNAIGYNEDREDQVEVANMPFALSSVVEPETKLVDRGFEILERLVMPIIYIVGGILFILLFLRPMLRMLAAQPAGRPAVRKAAGEGRKPSASEYVEDEEDLHLAPRQMTDKERIYHLAQSDPDRAADLVRRWLREEG